MGNERGTMVRRRWLVEYCAGRTQRRGKVQPVWPPDRIQITAGPWPKRTAAGLQPDNWTIAGPLADHRRTKTQVQLDYSLQLNQCQIVATKPSQD